METSLPTPMTARVELLIYQRVIHPHICSPRIVFFSFFKSISSKMLDTPRENDNPLEFKGIPIFRHLDTCDIPFYPNSSEQWLIFSCSNSQVTTSTQGWKNCEIFRKSIVTNWHLLNFHNVGPPSCKLVYKPHENYSYKYHKPYLLELCSPT